MWIDGLKQWSAVQVPTYRYSAGKCLTDLRRRGRDVGIQPKQVRWVVHALSLAQSLVILAKRRAYFFRPVVRRQVVDVGRAQEVWLQVAP